jgi:hypothetical protein
VLLASRNLFAPLAQKQKQALQAICMFLRWRVSHWMAIFLDKIERWKHSQKRLDLAISHTLGFFMGQEVLVSAQQHCVWRLYL